MRTAAPPARGRAECAWQGRGLGLQDKAGRDTWKNGGCGTPRDGRGCQRQGGRGVGEGYAAPCHIGTGLCQKRGAHKKLACFLAQRSAEEEEQCTGGVWPGVGDTGQGAVPCATAGQSASRVAGCPRSGWERRIRVIVLCCPCRGAAPELGRGTQAKRVGHTQPRRRPAARQQRRRRWQGRGPFPQDRSDGELDVGARRGAALTGGTHGASHAHTCTPGGARWCAARLASPLSEVLPQRLVVGEEGVEEVVHLQAGQGKGGVCQESVWVESVHQRLCILQGTAHQRVSRVHRLQGATEGRAWAAGGGSEGRCRGGRCCRGRCCGARQQGGALQLCLPSECRCSSPSYSTASCRPGRLPLPTPLTEMP